MLAYILEVYKVLAENISFFICCSLYIIPRLVWQHVRNKNHNTAWGSGISWLEKKRKRKWVDGIWKKIFYLGYVSTVVDWATTFSSMEVSVIRIYQQLKRSLTHCWGTCLLDLELKLHYLISDFITRSNYLIILHLTSSNIVIEFIFISAIKKCSHYYLYKEF